MSFQAKRRAFIIIGDTPIFQRPDDHRSFHDWCLNDLNISGAAWDTLIRGYFLDGDVVFFTGGDMYNPVTDLSVDLIDAVTNALCENGMDCAEPDVYNGVIPSYNQDVLWPRVFKYNYDNGRWELANE